MGSVNSLPREHVDGRIARGGKGKQRNIASKNNGRETEGVVKGQIHTDMGSSLQTAVQTIQIGTVCGLSEQPLASTKNKGWTSKDS